MKILLASASPRRQELLAALGYPFEVVRIDCAEMYPESLPPGEVAAYLSKLKSKAHRRLEADELLLTADTVVSLESEILGKPKDRDEAEKMLNKLSGKKHIVYTGLTLRSAKKMVTATDRAQVTFGTLTREEIQFYIETCKPFDKAGSYGVQDWLGLAKITAIEGSFYTVMGLPTHLVYDMLKDFTAIKAKF